MLATTSRAARRNATLLHSRQQARSFRFTRSWIAYFDHRSIRFDTKESKQASPDSSEKSPLDADTTPLPRRGAGGFGYLKNRGRTSGAKRTAYRSPDNPDGVRPGQNIEDAERAPLEHLVWGKHSPCLSVQRLRSANPRDSVLSAEGTPNDAPVDSGYIIDPITNRKVAKAAPETAYNTVDDGLEPAQDTFKAYRSQFTTLKAPVLDEARTPFSYDDAPPTIEPRGSELAKVDQQVSKTTSEDLLRTLCEQHEAVSWRANNSIASSQCPVPQAVEPESPKNDDLHKYSPVIGAEEPAVAEISSQTYEDLDKYSPVVGAREPGVTETRSMTYDDLDKYGPVVGAHGTPAVDMSSQKYGELDRYGPVVGAYEPAVPQASSRTYEDLEQYGAVKDTEREEITEQDSSRTPQDLGEYGAVRSHEPDGSYKVNEEPTVVPRELESYLPFRSDEPDGKYAGSSYMALEPDAEELARYSHPFLSHEPDGKYAEDYTSKAFEETPKPRIGGIIEQGGKGSSVADLGPGSEPPDLGNHEAFGYEDSETGSSRQPGASGEEHSDKTEYRRKFEELLNRPTIEWSVADAQAWRDLFKADHSPRPMTGNYVQDFPEEFSKSWSGEVKLHGEPETETKASSAVAATPLEPALERHTNSEQLTTEAPVTQTPEPTIYKVLVYDPKGDVLDVAETTSTVPDTATPMTPAEVLLRILNPSKFLSYFGPLKEEGFEIVSGADNVLVFRKVGTGAPLGHFPRMNKPNSTEADTAAAPKPATPRPAVNPIDMTGEARNYYVAADRFASPTGFVNYELPPQFDSRIDVHREEPVFSSPKSEPKQKKAGLLKRLVVGGVSVAGLSYSLSIVSEYFRTSRSDGKGPRRL